MVKRRGMSQVNKEWEKMEKAERAYLNRGLKRKEVGWQEKIEQFVPEQFENTLKQTFFKAFQMIFEKGTPVIEKTYSKEKKQQEYQVQEFATKLKNDPKSIKAFRKASTKSRTVNGVISTAESVGMGVLGMGLPDIPLFLGVLLKSIYEIALAYGFDYESEKEQMFILELMETALLYGDDLLEANSKLNRIIDAKEKILLQKDEQMKRTAEVLAREMLYLKFVQGIPIVGIVGGISDFVYQKKLTDYAELKYKRRFYRKANQMLT